MYVSVCMCMYSLKMHVSVLYLYLMYVCVCIVCMCMYDDHISAVCECIAGIGPDKDSSSHNVPKRPAPGPATPRPHSGRPWAGAQPLFSAIGDPPPDPFWRTRAHARVGGVQIGSMVSPIGPPSAVHRQQTRVKPHPR